MKREVIISGRAFTLKKAKGELRPITQVRTLSDCYAKPSEAKKAIYQDWFNWYLTVDSSDYQIVNMTIQSYNTCMFSIRMDVFDTKTYEFIGCLYITKTRQEFWTI